MKNSDILNNGPLKYKKFYQGHQVNYDYTETYIDLPSLAKTCGVLTNEIVEEDFETHFVVLTDLQDAITPCISASIVGVSIIYIRSRERVPEELIIDSITVNYNGEEKELCLLSNSFLSGHNAVYIDTNTTSLPIYMGIKELLKRHGCILQKAYFFSNETNVDRPDVWTVIKGGLK